MNSDEMVHSDVTGKDYNIRRAVRILNIRQVCTYMNLNIKPLDIYPSVDFKTNDPVLVFIFDREETRDAYKRWKESENLWEEVQNEKNCIS